MNKQSANNSNAEATQTATPKAWTPFIPAALMTGMTCFGFTAAASWILLLKLHLAGFDEEGLLLNLGIKGLVFSGLFALMVVLTRKSAPQPTLPAQASPNLAASPILYAITILLVLAMVYPNLTHYPWTASDELHHLVVTRNLAVHNAYASGNPATGFTYFDYYDSIGVSLLGPIALAFKAFGSSLLTARILLSTSYILLTLGVWCFIRRYWDTTAALISVLTMTLSFGSVYLARSLYGEVTALMFFIWSMLCWGKSFDSTRLRTLSALAGVLWGLAVLAKTFMMLSAFPIVAVWLYDRLTTKNIRWEHVIFPALGGIAVLGLWSAIVAHYQHLITEDLSMLVYYRHYLMFGLGSLATGLHWFYEQPFYTLGMALTIVVLIPCLVGRHNNPAVWVLLMTALLFFYWWLCFTPGTIGRYLWYSCAIVGIFAGPILRASWDWMRNPEASTPKRLFCTLIAISIVVPAWITGYYQVQLIYLHDEAADERNLALYLNELPEDTLVATDYPPAILSMDFMANRRVDLIEDFSKIDDKYSVIIYNRDQKTIQSDLRGTTVQIGRYTLKLRNDHKESIIE